MDSVTKGFRDCSSIFCADLLLDPSTVQPGCTLPSDLAPAQCPTPSDHVFIPPVAQEWTEDGTDFLAPERVYYHNRSPY